MEERRLAPVLRRHGLKEILDKPLLLGLVVSNDRNFRQTEDLPLWNGAAAQLLAEEIL